MANIISKYFLLFLVVILPSFLCQKTYRPFWRKWKNSTKKATKPAEPTLPPVAKNLEFYRRKYFSILFKISKVCRENFKVVVNVP